MVLRASVHSFGVIDDAELALDTDFLEHERAEHRDVDVMHVVFGLRLAFKLVQLKQY